MTRTHIGGVWLRILAAVLCVIGIILVETHAVTLAHAQPQHTDDPWLIPQEAHRAAWDYLATAPLRRFSFLGKDSTAVDEGRVRLGIPFRWYRLPDSSRADFLGSLDPNPLRYAPRRDDYMFPLIYDNDSVWMLEVFYHPASGYRVRGPSAGTIKGTDADLMRDREDVSELLGLITFGFGSGLWWAYTDTTGSVVFEEIAIHANYASRADYVVVGTLKNLRSRAISVTEHHDSSSGTQERIRYYDVAEIDVAKVLKGPFSTPYLKICFPSMRPADDLAHFGLVDVEEGDERIWMLNSDELGVLSHGFVLQGASWVQSIKHLDAVMAHLPDPPPKAIDRPMTRGAAWNADLTGEKGVTVFFILGMLNEYSSGRHFIEDSALVESFYCNEQETATVFERYLAQLSREQGLDAKRWKEIRQSCLPRFHSDVLSAFINSFYDYTLTTAAQVQTDDGMKAMAHAPLSKDVFEGLGREVVLAYLAGAYCRHGENNSFRFANSYKRMKLIAQLLQEVGCPVEITSESGGPVGYRLSFEPTDEFTKWLERLPE